MWLSGSSYRKSFIFEMIADESRKKSIEPHDSTPWSLKNTFIMKYRTQELTKFSLFMIKV